MMMMAIDNGDNEDYDDNDDDDNDDDDNDVDNDDNEDLAKDDKALGLSCLLGNSLPFTPTLTFPIDDDDNDVGADDDDDGCRWTCNACVVCLTL